MRKVWLILCVLVSAILYGCRTTRQAVEVVPRVIHDTHIEYVHDSIWQDRWHDRWLSGDTVFMHDSIYIEKWRTKRDTIKSVDSIPYVVEVEVPVEVEKQLSGNQVFLIRSGVALWIVLAVVLLGVIVGVAIKVSK